MKFAAVLLGLLVLVAPLRAQTEARVEAIAAAVEHALEESRFADAPRSRLLFDTLRADIPTREAAQLARKLGFRPGRSEEQCRRFLLDEESRSRMWHPVGVEVHGVEAILTTSVSELAADSAYVWVSIMSGAGQHLNGPSSYVLRRVSDRWDVEPHLSSSGGYCQPQLFTTPLALAAQAILDDLGADGPTCLDPTGFPLLERDSVAAELGAQIRGQWVPEVDGETPGPFRDPCATSDTQWGGIVRFIEVDWETDDAIQVTLEARVPAGASRRLRHILRRENGEWKLVNKEDASTPEQGSSG